MAAVHLAGVGGKIRSALLALRMASEYAKDSDDEAVQTLGTRLATHADHLESVKDAAALTAREVFKRSDQQEADDAR
jgi:hypothetical protein